MRIKLCESEFDAVDICTVGCFLDLKYGPIQSERWVIGSCSINDKHWMISSQKLATELGTEVQGIPFARSK